MVRKSLIILLIFLSGHSFISAQETRDDLSKQAANPIADLMSFPFQNNLNIDYGEFNRNMNVLNIQPVLPFAKGRIVTRTILPILWIPDFYHESGMLSSGIGDIVFTAFYVPANQPFIWGVGPVVEFPTGGEY
ncbi:MAG TPA: hypothetical protein VK994_02890, partial [Bacteroidales bacterium]|nr:hypothetical protein [Bacteroidales bacterium]